MFARTTVIAAALAALSGSALGTSDRTSKMYDLRDLAAVLPGSSSGGTGGGAQRLFTEMVGVGVDTDGSGSSGVILSGVPKGERSMWQDDRAAPEAGVDNDSPTDRLVSKLANLLALMPEELIENVYFIDGEDESHTRFADAIESVRALHRDRVQVEVSCYEVAASDRPTVGDEAAPGETATVGGTTVVSRRSLARVEATRTVSFIADWEPVVGDASVGFDPSLASITDGAAFGVRVGPGKEKVRVGVRGVVSKVEISNEQVQSDRAMAAGGVAMAPGGPLLPIGLPRVGRRVIDTDVSIPLDRAIVVATVPGFKEGTRLVVAVSVKVVE